MNHEQTPSAGAVRAAKAFIYGITEYDDNERRRLALIIDRETGLAEAVKALQEIVNTVEHTTRKQIAKVARETLVKLEQ